MEGLIMGGFGPLVSSRLSFYNENPSRPISIAEVDHEVETLQERKKIAGATAVIGGTLSLVTMIGLLGAGWFIAGALLAIAMIAGLYAYCCKEAEEDLKEKKSDWVIAPVEQRPLIELDQVRQAVRQQS